MPVAALHEMAYGRLRQLHEPAHVHRHGLDIGFDPQVAIVVSCTRADDDQVATAERLEDSVEDRGRVRLRHVETTHDRVWRKRLAHCVDSIEASGQQSTTP